MIDLGPAVETTLSRCLNVRASEQVVVVADPGTVKLGAALRDGAAALGADATLIVIDERQDHGNEPPRPVAAALGACDVFIAPTTKSLSHTDARRRATEAGARGATMPGVTEEMLARVMAIDHEQLRARSRAVAQLLQRGSQARISCPRGTDLTLNLTGRAGSADDGDLTAPGAFGNLPAGEGFISPVDGFGTLAPSTLAGIGMAQTPFTLTVSDGRLSDATGEVGVHFRRLLAPYGELGFNLAELGIGTNEAAILTGNVLEDEKILGTAHVAFGASAGIGGTVSVPIHLDAVIVDATVEIDGRPVLHSGRYVLDA